MNQEEQQIAEYLHFSCGVSGRKIASLLDKPKSTINDHLKRLREQRENIPDGAKILIFDIETAPNIGYYWSRWKTNIGQPQVIQESFMLTWCAKWLGSDEIFMDSLHYHSDEVTPDADEAIIHNLWKLIDKANIIVAHNCVEKTTPVLRKDLNWVQAGDLVEGDEIIAFEEGKPPTTKNRDEDGKWVESCERRSGRQLSVAKVTQNFTEKKPCVKVVLSNGDEVVTTKDHYWLGMAEKDNNLRWYASENLRKGQRLYKYFNPWEKDKSYEAGWVSGFFSGEGTVKKCGNEGVISSLDACQRPGPTWDQFFDFCKKLQIPLTKTPRKKTGGLGRQDTEYSYTTGGKWKALEVIGKLDIQRFKDNIDWDNLGTLKGRNIEKVEVVDVVDVGVQEVAVLSTSSKTFFAGGYAMHNCDRFDEPTFNTRALYHGLRPPHPSKRVDTLKVAKANFRFPSNSMDGIMHYLGMDERKSDTGGFSLWSRCMDGDTEAFEQMLEYNAQDVVVLEQLYMKLRPWDRRHPNVALFGNLGSKLCGCCGSARLERTGQFAYTNVSKFPTYRCMDCGTVKRSRKSIVDKEDREDILMNVAR